MADAHPMFLKLYFVYMIQRRGIENMVSLLNSRGQTHLVQLNQAFTMGLLTEQQKHYWGEWVKELTSPVVANHMDHLESLYGVIEDIRPSTHIEEFIPETKTVLIIEN